MPNARTMPQAGELFDPEVWEAPDIRTPLPGPRAAKLVEKDGRYISPSMTRPYPLAAKRGKGSVVEDVDGNRFIDFNAGIACCSTGHCHPRVVRAIQEQAATLLHYAGTDFYYEAQADLAERLAAIAPGGVPRKVFFGNTGTEAVEGALKLARWHTGRKQFIAFIGGFHGRTMGSLALTASKVTQRKRFFPMMLGVTHIPYGNCYRCPLNLTYPSCNIACVSVIEDLYFARLLDPEDVAAIVVEPIQGEGGYVVPPDGYHQALRALADKYGILYIADEVQSGMGRTGKMFAQEHWGIVADIITVGKGIASGMVIAPIIARAEIMDWTPGSHGNTFGGNPVSCRAALETIALLEEGLMAHAGKMGDYLLGELQNMQKHHRLIGDVRGRGLMVGVELVTDRVTKAPAIKEAERVVRRCFEKGMLTLPCGQNVIRISPPLVISRDQLARGLEILDEALTEIEAE